MNADGQTILLLYTHDAEIDEATLEKMREAGYLPVRVASLDAVKLVPAPMPQAHFDMLAHAAFATIDSFESSVPQAFGKRVAAMLAGIKPAKPQ